jgi:hypothetical protein
MWRYIEKRFGQAPPLPHWGMPEEAPPWWFETPHEENSELDEEEE